MTDQQRLREALHAAVPDAPTESRQGDVIRARARRTRLLRVTAAGALVGVVGLASTALWAAHRHEPGPTVTGAGEAACRHLSRQLNAGDYVDSRVVDGSTATAWLSGLNTDVDPAAYRQDQRVTVCVTFPHTSYATYVVGQSGHPERVTAGAYTAPGGVQQVMTRLDRLITGGRTTTTGPFTCSGSPTKTYPDVTSSLPGGAIAARICFGGGFFTPPQALTSDVGSLVRKVNASAIEYVAPNVSCTGGGEPEFTIVFRYASGTRSVSEEECRGLAIGRYTRSGGVNLDRDFMSLLAQQVGVDPASVPAPPCPSTRSDEPVGVGDPRNVVAARYCPGGESRGLPLDRARLALLRSWGGSLEYGVSSAPERVCAVGTTGWPTLVLADAWGDRFTMVVEGCGRNRFPSVVSPGAPHQVTHPDGSRGPFLRLVRQLAQGP
jgi:hypothetical protein